MPLADSEHVYLGIYDDTKFRKSQFRSIGCLPLANSGHVYLFIYDDTKFRKK